MTIDELKKLLKIPLDDTSKDDFFNTILPFAIDFAKIYCKDDFDSGLPEGLKLGIGKLVEFYEQKTGVTSEKIADLARNFADPSTISDSILTYFEPYKKKKVKFV